LDEANRRGVNSTAPRDEGSSADALHGDVEKMKSLQFISNAACSSQTLALPFM
jgi:hypothetical protein